MQISTFKQTMSASTSTWCIYESRPSSDLIKQDMLSDSEAVVGDGGDCSTTDGQR